MKKFFKANGYYFILIACVLAVCIGGIIALEKRAADNTELPEQLLNQPVATLKPSSADADDEPTTVPTQTPTLAPTETPTAIPTEAPETTEAPTLKPSGTEDDTEDSTEVNKPVDKNDDASGDTSGDTSGKKFTLPVGSLNIITEFADDKLVYNKTLKEWRIHPALDLAAPAGSNVVCAMDGKVSDVLSDPLYGTTIIVDHGNDTQTVYSGVVVASDITTGKEVKSGTILGTVSENGIFCERDIESHIHFEVIQGGKKVNPSSFIDTATSADGDDSEANG